MLATSNAPDRARWEVLWVKDRKVHRKDCGTSLSEAMRIYQLVLEAGRPGATLRCKNMGFPPPEELMPRRVRGKKGGKIVEGILRPLKAKNLEGIFWCPYCMKLRRFTTKRDHVVEGIPIRDEIHCCPMCKVSTRDHNVRKYNPVAAKITYEIEAKGTRSAPKTAQERRAAYRRKQQRQERS